MKRHSRQRDTVLKVLRSTDTHPTASWIYEKSREQIPNISLGTVYRNLFELCNEGEILSLAVGDGFEHFDGNAKEHLHLYCKKCGKIFDMPVNNHSLLNSAKKHGFTPEKAVYLLHGICKSCSENCNK